MLHFYQKSSRGVSKCLRTWKILGFGECRLAKIWIKKRKEIAFICIPRLKQLSRTTPKDTDGA
jgi:hypothetical protein